MNRVHNFSAGPAILPHEVLLQAQEELTDYHGTGASIMEKSHRGPDYTRVDAEARERLNRILGLGNDFDIMFLQGGASGQFYMAPMNFLSEEETADYINTGTWSKKAIKEAKLFGNVHVPFSSEDSSFDHVPQDKLKYSSDARYVHFTSNNTIFGTQFRSEPETEGVPLVCDASSDFLSRPLDMDKYGLLYAGAQKNLGPAGVTVVIIRKSFRDQITKTHIPTILDYRTHADGAMFNTPPVFPVYMVNLVLKWIEDNGGLSYFKKLSEEKSELLYQEIDADDFYTGTVKPDSRSQMNVTFRLPSEELEKEFLEEAASHDLVALKGHRSVGGIRASIYNACPKESVEALAAFMREFRARKG